jgi:mono/diheme cytochrome c family protein
VTAQACTPAIDGAALYTATCSGCHGPLATSTLKGRNISLALIYQFNMQHGLTDPQLQAIVTAVGP